MGNWFGHRKPVQPGQQDVRDYDDLVRSDERQTGALRNAEIGNYFDHHNIDEELQANEANVLGATASDSLTNEVDMESPAIDDEINDNNIPNIILFEEEIDNKSNIFITDDVSCGICMTDYDNTNRMANVLPCGHILCLNCVQEISKENNFRCCTCPWCKKKHNIKQPALRRSGASNYSSDLGFSRQRNDSSNVSYDFAVRRWDNPSNTSSDLGFRRQRSESSNDSYDFAVSRLDNPSNQSPNLRSRRQRSESSNDSCDFALRRLLDDSSNSSSDLRFSGQRLVSSIDSCDRLRRLLDDSSNSSSDLRFSGQRLVSSNDSCDRLRRLLDDSSNSSSD